MASFTHIRSKKPPHLHKSTYVSCVNNRNQVGIVPTNWLVATIKRKKAESVRCCILKTASHRQYLHISMYVNCDSNRNSDGIVPVSWFESKMKRSN